MITENKVMTDIEIANSASIIPIETIAEKIGLSKDDLELYGKYKAKLPLSLINEEKYNSSNLVLVTALTPTPSGEGKTTASIGLLDGLNKIDKKAIAALREPSLGPVFGIKGGAAGGGYSQVIPMEDINLHFTGDFSAIEKANNLLSAVIDNVIHHGNKLNIDARTVVWKRVMDMNDRSLRDIVIGLGGKTGGIPRQDGFNITAASEIMAILCMSKDFEDLKIKLGNIYVADTFDKEPVYAKQLNVVDAMAILLKDAIKPNLVQTLEGNPVVIHGGPFANIAQGTNSLIATKIAMSLADYTITEAGFGADLGAEKFLNLKCRHGEIKPKAVVIVATIKALKYHGGAPLKDLQLENTAAVKAGLANIKRHIENIQSFDLPVVVAINKFHTDTDAEIKEIEKAFEGSNVQVSLSEGWAKGGNGTTDLAKKVVAACEGNTSNELSFTYSTSDTIEEKISNIAKKIYRAKEVKFAPKALTALKKINANGWNELPICMAKTQKSFSDNEKLIGAPSDFVMTVREIEYATGAGFIVPITGAMMRMPGLPSVPASEGMQIDGNGKISGLS